MAVVNLVWISVMIEISDITYENVEIPRTKISHKISVYFLEAKVYVVNFDFGSNV